MPSATVLRAETTQRAGIQYAVVLCQQRTQLRATAARLARTLLIEARCLRSTQKAESAAKGIIYCRSKALCDEIADAIGCPAYYADIEGRAEVLSTWRQLGGLIVSTSALGVGVDIPRVCFTLHVERPWGMIDFVQESGRMRASGKSIVLLTQPQPQPHKLKTDEMDDSEAMEAFVRTAGCRRAVMSQYMDGKQLSCAELQATAAEIAACDNCEEQQSSGRRAWQDEQAVQAVQEQAVRAKLDELAQSTCPYCWALVHEVFEGQANEAGELGQQQQEVMRHSLWQCPRAPKVAEMEEIRRGVWYSRDVRTCRKCEMIDYLCERGSSSSSSSSSSSLSTEKSKQQNCTWPNVVIPLLYGLRAAAEAKATLAGNDTSVYMYTTLGRVGYRERDGSSVGFGRGISRQYVDRRVFGRVVGNGVAAVVAAILEEQG